MIEMTQVKKILSTQNLTPDQVELFERLYKRFKEQKGKKMDWAQVSSPKEESIIDYKSLDKANQQEASLLLNKLAVCRLNGGLGTSMGCVGPKSAIEVRNGQSFLDLIVTQIHCLNQKYNSQVPLILMNSASTDQDTQKIIKKYHGEVDIHCFQQNYLPRIRKDSELPMSIEKFGDGIFYPPGHGDFYDAFYRSGLLDRMIQEGKEILFVGNADNLGASIDLSILKLMHDRKAPFLMEVTPKTRADVKGGTLVRTPERDLSLLEIAQVPGDYLEEFKSVRKFKIFNTNNVWINLKAFQQKMQSGGMDLEVIVNHKTWQHIPVIQLETAIGGGIKSFEGSLAVQVPRHRFLPVKKTDDLLLVQSNLFEVIDGLLVKNPNRQFAGLPMVRLGDHFRNYEEYQARIPRIPDILELDLLTVVGDVHFGKDMVLRGNVILVCDQGELHLPDGCHLENKVLTGNISIGEL